MIYASPVGSETQNPTDAKITLVIRRQPDMFLGVQIALHEKFGLTTDALRGQFFAFLRSTKRITDDNPLPRWADTLRKDADIIKNLNACQNQPQCTIPFTVYEWFLTALREFGVDFVILPNGDVQVRGVNPKLDVSQWTTTDKFIEVVKRAAALLPADVGKELLALIDPLVIGIAVAVVMVWAVSQFFGIGEIVDVILLIVGVISLGPIAWRAGEHLINFAVKTVNGKTGEELDDAAKDLSAAVALIGVQVVMALLLKKAPKVFNEPRVNMNKGLVEPFTLKTIGEPPVTPGELFYKPKTFELKNPFPTEKVPGSTNQWGDTILQIGKKSLPEEIELTKFHEDFHSFLSPKLQTFTWLRQARAVLKTNSYLKSHLLRYIEEMLAETFAQVRANNWRRIFEGVKFPVGEEGYVTVAKMGVEATGILLGPINVSGMVFNVYFTYSKDW